MAEFKLGRIRFVWKDNWTTGTTYYKDDVVKYGGKVYICVVGHSAAADFYTDLDNVPTKWNLFADGQEWKGNWSVDITYKIGDIVKNGGYLYICNEGHTSGTTFGEDSTKWDLFGEGVNWAGLWTPSTSYNINDIVKYGGNTYVCNEAHVSAATTTLGLEADIGKFDLFAEGFEWLGPWNAATRYRVNDVVQYGGQVYVCNEYHTSSDATSGLEDDQAKWDYFQKGVEYKGNWAGLTRYKINDIVKYGGGTWICVIHHTSTSSFNTTNFQQLIEGVEFEGVWNSSTIYQPGDIVRYGGYTYISTTVHSNSVPTALTNWNLFVESFKFEGNYSSGTSYKVGETVRHGGYTYVAIQDNTAQNPETATTYWSRLNSGIRWRGEWANSVAYLLGDIVKFNSSSYICVQGHTSDDDDSTITPTSNSPEKDTSGLYWNLITGGLEESVLTTSGDLVYYGNVGPTRLPIGADGQVLAVVNGEPAWRYWGQVDNVFYVGLHGVDSPAPEYGVTLDKPWRTVRYATDQVQHGIKYPDATYLLEYNRTFIQKEIVEWVDYQITNNILPFFTGFTYDKDKCQRDMGLLVDAVIHDLRHGGNIKSREAAFAYFTTLGASYITGQEDQTVAAINYGLSLMNFVLENSAPAANYQALNGISVGDRIKQVVNENKVSESGAYEVSASLVGIVTDAITAASTSDIPAEDQPTYTIFIKTGLFEEVLPIRIPAQTAVVGDELRSTRVSPAGKLIASSDKAKSLQALAHIRSITDNVILNSAVTPTSGNDELQDTTSQKAGDNGSPTSITRILNNAAEIKDIVTNGAGAANAYSYPDPTGYSSGWSNARRLVLANKTFLQEEVGAYMALNYSSIWSALSADDKLKCKRDIGYLVDALVYDLTYGETSGCNLATIIVARSYFTLGELVEPAAQKTALLAVYGRIIAIIDDIATATAVTPTTGNTEIQDVSGTAGSAPAGAFAVARVTEVRDVINTAEGTPLPAEIPPSLAWVATEYVTARETIMAVKTEIQADAVAYIKRSFPTLKFDEALCSRDVGYMVDALGYDLVFNSNYLSIQNGLSYQRGLASTEVVLTQQLAAQQAIIDYIGIKTSEIAASGAVAYADLLWQYIIGMVTGEALAVTTGTLSPVTNLNMINGANILRLNADFLAAEASAYIDLNNKTTVTASSSANNRFTCTSTSWMAVGDSIKFRGVVYGGVNTTTEYYVKTIHSSTEFDVSLTRDFDTGTVGPVLTLTTNTASMEVYYSYDASRCQNDVKRYIDAMVQDMIYTGNNHVVLASRYYINALRGSKLEDMYYVRNGCGVRNQTLIGLDGSSDGNVTGQQDALTAANEFGTRRPNAGAYVSLDPGYGPSDSTVWVTNKSTYVQNVTTFGIGCVGQKIDGALHNGGNDSIVSNDFTQVLSDGIGAWVTNLGRAELVSVFSYYNHIGYLAENGGKIRATNGNNSYGDFGAVSEGVDITENAITAKVDNRANEANVPNVIVDGTKILSFEYANAGSDYNSATFTISGAGSNAAVESLEQRYGGVYQVRLTDPGDSSGTGGTGYITATATAQGGNTTQITLAATDSALSTAYIGMHILITAGTGAGQYGIINTFNAGSKVATIVKESDGTPGWEHLIPGTTIAASLDLSTNYEITPRLIFSEPPFSKSLETLPAGRNWTDLVLGDGYGSYTGLTATGGSGSAATFDVIRRFGSYVVTINAFGFAYDVGDELTIAGTALGGTSPANDLTITVTSIDDNDGSLFEVSSSGTAISHQIIALASGTDQAARSTDGVTWSNVTLPASRNWKAIAYGPVNNIGTYVAIARESTSVAYSTDGINWTAGALGEVADWTDIAYGNGRFVAVAESDSSTTFRAVTLDGGAVWSTGSVATGAKAIEYGLGRFVIVEGNFSNAVASSTDGTTWTLTTLPANADSTESNWQDLAFGNGLFVAIADNNRSVAISSNGTSWTGGAYLPADADWRHLGYGNGVFTAIAVGSDKLATSTDGITWTLRNSDVRQIDILGTSKDDSSGWASTNTALPLSTTWGGIAYNGTDRYVAAGADGSSASYVAYSSNGTSWTAGTIPAGTNDVRCIAYGAGVWVAPYVGSNDIATSADGVTFTFQSNVLPATRDWAAITFGGGKFVMVDGAGTTSAAYSTNGTTWSAAVMPSSSTWTSIVYGNGRFVAVSGASSASTAGAYSADGISWSASTMPNNLWSSVAYGNSRFVAVAGNTTTATSVAAYSTDNGATWTSATLPGAAANWTNIVHNGSVFVATAYNSNRSAISEDGVTWTSITIDSSNNWKASTTDLNGKVVVISTGNDDVATISYTANTNYLTVSTEDYNDLSVNDVITVPADSAGIELFGGLSSETPYYIVSKTASSNSGGYKISVSTTSGGSALTLTTGTGSMFATVNKVWSKLKFVKLPDNARFIGLAENNSKAASIYAGTKTKARAYILGETLYEVWIREPGSNYDPENPPTMTIVDPSNSVEATYQVRIGDRVLAQPNFSNRGTGYAASSVTLVGDGYADNYQTGGFLNFKDITDVPKEGSNLKIDGIDDIYYKVVSIRNLAGTSTYSALIQISPVIGAAEAPEHEAAVELRRRFSQVRLTGHDFLDIGTGNREETNYPDLPTQDPIPAQETRQSNGGRVFWTSTDQDGNFRVGGLFNVEQSTGTATLNADAFNLAGLNELSLGTVGLGGGAVINEFSTDPFFTADSDAVVPTQRAIKAYINSQIGGGGSSLNVNTLTAGVIYVAGQSITTTNSSQININTTVNFTGGIDGYPVALNLFLNA